MIYADHAATTPVSDCAFNAMMPFLQAQYGNASSQYTFGVRAKYAVDHARRQIASALNAEPESIIFTSGGSEANTWVIRCTAERFFGEPIHIVTLSLIHI